MRCFHFLGERLGDGIELYRGTRFRVSRTKTNCAGRYVDTSRANFAMSMTSLVYSLHRC